jgi:proteasome lid subunit RPN8/RPN11
MKIKQRVVQSIIEACKSAYPNEFLGLLRQEKGVINELLFVAGATKMDLHSSSLRRDMVPLDPSVIGSVHSHPSKPVPSAADKNFFSKFGKIHLIVGYPFRPQDIRVYGAERSLEIVK